MDKSPFLNQPIKNIKRTREQVFIEFYKNQNSYDSSIGSCNECGVSIMTNYYNWLHGYMCFCSEKCFEKQDKAKFGFLDLVGH